MGGFKNEVLDNDFNCGIINIIISHLAKCSKKMKCDCIVNGNLLKNNEDAITNRLTAQYLNSDNEALFRYETQSQENFNDETDFYKGRTDIKVISSDYFRDSQAYYIIECKRIDGTITLNQKYITDGISRFFPPIFKPKYSSYYSKNIMFGYVVQTIDIPSNAIIIRELQTNYLNNVTASDFLLLSNNDLDSYVYSCQYEENTKNIELRHLFYDFAAAIRI